MLDATLFWCAYVLAYALLAGRWSNDTQPKPQHSQFYLYLNVGVIGPTMALLFLFYGARPNGTDSFLSQGLAAVLAVLLYDAFFWALHLLCHTSSFLYVHVHAWHHRWTRTSHGQSALDCHPLEMICVDMAPFLLALYLTGVETWLATLMLAVGSVMTQWTHATLDSSHDCHHAHRTCGFGTMWFFDWLAGTKCNAATCGRRMKQLVENERRGGH